MKYRFIALLATIGLLVSGVSFAGGHSAPKAKDIVDTAVAADDFNTLVAAVKAAGLIDALQGVLGSMSGLVAILSPPFMTQLFAYFSSDTAMVYFPGAPFFVSAIFTVLAMVLLLRTVSRRTA